MTLLYACMLYRTAQQGSSKSLESRTFKYLSALVLHDTWAAGCQQEKLQRFFTGIAEMYLWGVCNRPGSTTMREVHYLIQW